VSIVSSDIQNACNDVNSTLKFIKNCTLKAGMNEYRTHQNYKNTKLHIVKLNRETNKRKQKKETKKHSGQV